MPARQKPAPRKVYVNTRPMRGDPRSPRGTRRFRLYDTAAAHRPESHGRSEARLPPLRRGGSSRAATSSRHASGGRPGPGAPVTQMHYAATGRDHSRNGSRDSEKASPRARAHEVARGRHHPGERHHPESEPMIIGRNFLVKSTPTSQLRRGVLNRGGGRED